MIEIFLRKKKKILQEENLIIHELQARVDKLLFVQLFRVVFDMEFSDKKNDK